MSEKKPCGVCLNHGCVKHRDLATGEVCVHGSLARTTLASIREAKP